MRTRPARRRFRTLLCEGLEPRCVLSAIAGSLAGSPAALHSGDFQATIVAGISPDSPENRIDANDSLSAFRGVGSLRINTRSGAYICTGTPISETHILTAAHCVDINNDGRSDGKDGITSVIFNVNDATQSPDVIDLQAAASSWTIHPDFTGFSRPSINDDLAVITLAAPLPAAVPTYALPASDLTVGTTIHLVGYGRSGDGVNGYTTGASFTVKRYGQNVVDAFYAQDDDGRPAANEVFRFDFDGPSGNGPLGGSTLGNTLETTLGGGDSGGPSFVLQDDSYVLVGVNTFTQGFTAPRFGSLGGGMNVFPYVDWINAVLAGEGGGDNGGGGSKGKGGGPKAGRNVFAVDSEWLVGGLSSPAVSHTTDVLAHQPTGWSTAATKANWQADQASQLWAGRGLVLASVPNTHTSLEDTSATPSGRRLASDTDHDPAVALDWAPAVDAILSRWSA